MSATTISVADAMGALLAAAMREYEEELLKLAEANKRVADAKNRLDAIQAMLGGTTTAQANDADKKRPNEIQALSGGTTTVEVFGVDKVARALGGQLLNKGRFVNKSVDDIRGHAREYFEGKGKKLVTAEEILEFAKTMGDFKHDDGTLRKGMTDEQYKVLENQRMDDFLKFLRE